MDDRKFDISIKHLDYFEQFIPPTLSHFHEKIPNSVQWFTLGMLQRLLYSSKAIKKLLSDYYDSPELDFSIGILIRPVILDSLIGFNLLAILKDCLAEKLHMDLIIEKIDKFCNGILSDGLLQTLKYFKQLESYGLIEADDLKGMYNQFSSNYTNFLAQPNGRNTMPEAKYVVNSKANNQFKILAQDLDLKPIAHSLYELYSIYSKYDHFGFLFFEIYNYEQEIKIKRISAAISFFVNHCANLYDMLQRVTPNDQFVCGMFNSSREYLTNNNS